MGGVDDAETHEEGSSNADPATADVEEDEEEEEDEEDEEEKPSEILNPNEMATMTEPDNLGPCEPGTAVKLQGVVWKETDKGKTND